MSADCAFHERGSFLYKILDTCLDVLLRVNLAKPKRSNKSKSMVSEIPVVSDIRTRFGFVGNNSAFLRNGRNIHLFLGIQLSILQNSALYSSVSFEDMVPKNENILKIIRQNFGSQNSIAFSQHPIKIEYYESYDSGCE